METSLSDLEKQALSLNRGNRADEEYRKILTAIRQTDLDIHGSDSAFADENLSDREAVMLAVRRYHDLQTGARELFRKYQAALIGMRTRLEILDQDLDARRAHNPIHHIEDRLKDPRSTFAKIVRYGKPLTLESIEENIMDIAGMRVICRYSSDVYDLIETMGVQDDLQIVAVKDYIKNPKPNGYRSLHVIVKVPIYFMDAKEYVPVEIQIRTIAMDFWAALEHSLRYKASRKVNEIDMVAELKNCSQIIEGVEERMQILLDVIENPDATPEEIEAYRLRLEDFKFQQAGIILDATE